ncbi:class I SAM-dependent methyltransferase [Leptospira sp. SA-E8]|uniref:class I SAM-dependent methyltransferase n=1 Tax=Leptospira sp. SA-E8 TaxID=3422259 RepID=UPI003EBA362E
MLSLAKRFLRYLKARRKLPLKGYKEGLTSSGAVDDLSDTELELLNRLLPWSCFTATLDGRRFGNAAWEGKRGTPQMIPDARIEVLNQLFDLREKSVLEVGAFEGVHTIGLSKFAREVVAIDSRIENVVKTIVRTNLFGFKPSVSLCDVEVDDQFRKLPQVDVIHHVGVLYHLKDPVRHLQRLAAKARVGMLLDTHYATTEMASDLYEVSGQVFRYFNYRESGRKDVFSGMYDHAKWLLMDDIKTLLRDAGFTDIRVTQDGLQRNGPRVTLYAARKGVMRGNASIHG